MAAGRCLPLAMCADALLTPLSRLPPRPLALTRSLPWQSSPRPTPTGRVKRYLWESGPRCLPFDKDLCPAMPFRAPWLEPSPEARFGHRGPGCRRLFTNVALSDPLARLPFTRPVATGYALLLSLGAACRLSATWIRRAGTPKRATRSSHANCRHQPMPVALAFDAFPRRDQRATTCTKQAAGRSDREKARRVSRTISHVPSSWRFGHPWSPVRLFAGLDIPARVRPGQDPSSDGASRKATSFDGSGCLLPWRNPYATEQRCCWGTPGSSPRHAASVEALLGGSRAFGDRIATACL
jgi:hypothetical protein